MYLLKCLQVKMLSAEMPASSADNSEWVATTESSEDSSEDLKIFQVFVCLLGMVGIIGNGLVLVVMGSQKKTRKQITGSLVLNQSLADFFCSIFIIITYGYNLNPVSRYDIHGRQVICYLIVDELFLFNTMNASTYSLVVITLERYMMIVMPILHRNSFTKQRALIMVGFAWVAGYLWNTPATLLTTFVSHETGECIAFVWNDLQAQITFGITYMTATFFIPMVFFAFAYSHMGWVLHKRAFQLEGMEPKSHAEGQKRTKLTRAQVNMTKTMVMVTLAFAICWTPNQIYYLMYNLGYNLNFASVGYLTTLFMSLLNSCINPWIYAFKLESFKSGLASKFKKLKCCGNGNLQELNTFSENTQNSHM